VPFPTPLRLLIHILVLCGSTALVSAQHTPDHPMPGMQHDSSAMNLPQMPGMMMQPTNLIESQLNHLSSGTSSEPASGRLE